MGVGEERLVLADKLALVVEDSPATAYPARANRVPRHHRQAIRSDDDFAVGIALGCRSWIGLDLLLDLPAEPIRVGEADLDFRLRDAGVEKVRLACESRGKWRFSQAFEPIEIVNDTGRGFAQEIVHNLRGHAFLGIR